MLRTHRPVEPDESALDAESVAKLRNGREFLASLHNSLCGGPVAAERTWTAADVQAERDTAFEVEATRRLEARLAAKQGGGA